MSWQNLQSNSHHEVTYHQTLSSKAKPDRSEEFTTLCLPICFHSLSLPPALRLPCVFRATLRKQNPLPVGSSLLAIFKSPQKFLLSSAANASCLWKQFQFIFYKGKKKKKKSTASKALQVSTLFSCIVFLIKKEFFGTTEALNGSTQAFLTPPSSQTVAFKMWPFPFVKARSLFWVGFPCRLFCTSSHAAPPRSCCCCSLWDHHPVLLTPSCCSWGAVCYHGVGQTPGMDGQNPSASESSHKF